MLRRHALSTVTAVVIAMIQVATLVFVYLAVSWYLDRQEAGQIASLPEPARIALDQLQEEGQPDAASLKLLAQQMLLMEEQDEVAPVVSFFIFGSVAVVVWSITGFWLAKLITAPLERLTAVAERVRNGEFRVTVEASATREVAILARTLNLLASDLETLERRLRFNTRSIAHELRTPLTVIQGNLQAFADGVYPMTREGVLKILSQVQGLSRLVDQLNTLSLASSQSLVGELVLRDLSSEVANIVDMAEIALAEDDLSYERSLSPAPALIDPVRFRQAVLALIDNATRYASAGRFVRCETGMTAAGEPYVSVMDGGPGLPQEIIYSNFDMFWRAEPSRSRNTGGAGLGLSVVKAIVTGHGARLEASNLPAGGAAFTIVFDPPGSAASTDGKSPRAAAGILSPERS